MSSCSFLRERLLVLLIAFLMPPPSLSSTYFDPTHPDSAHRSSHYWPEEGLRVARATGKGKSEHACVGNSQKNHPLWKS